MTLALKPQQIGTEAEDRRSLSIHDTIITPLARLMAFFSQQVGRKEHTDSDSSMSGQCHIIEASPTPACHSPASQELTTSAEPSNDFLTNYKVHPSQLSLAIEGLLAS